MNEMEEQLQDDIERGRAAEGRDADAYRRVFHALGQEPEYELSADFAHKVMARAAEGHANRFSNDYLWFAAGILFLAVSFALTLRFIGFHLDFGFLTVMADYKGLAIFGVILILFLNWLDKKLVREKRFQQKF